ncbi:MAG: glycosyltransferase family 4 protein [Chitinophagaceae bacterium]|nr:glycosyltransferase family 4 protein [Chitinophagaceae bacterium]
MTVGLFNSADGYGGGEKQYFEWAVYLLKKSYNVHFFLKKNGMLHEKLIDVEGIHLHFINISPLSFLNPVKVRRLKKLFIQCNLQTLMIILSTDLKVAGRSAALAGVEKIIYTRAVPVPIKNTVLNRFIYSQWVTNIIANSHATARSILKKNPRLISSDKIKLIYNLIDTEEIIHRPFTKIYKKAKEEFIIGSAGRLEKEKNFQFLIKLSLSLRKKSMAHKILISGTGSLEGELKKQVELNKVEDNILFVGFQENIKDVLMCCDVFVSPSLYEGFGFAIAEASLCQLPVIAFNTTSIPELVVDGETGFITDLNSVEQVAEKIHWLKQNPELSMQMGARGRNFMVENFDKEKIMAEFEQFLRDA